MLSEPESAGVSFPRTLFAFAPTVETAFLLMPRTVNSMAPVSRTGKASIFICSRGRCEVDSLCPSDCILYFSVCAEEILARSVH